MVVSYFKNKSVRMEIILLSLALKKNREPYFLLHEIHAHLVNHVNCMCKCVSTYTSCKQG